MDSQNKLTILIELAREAGMEIRHVPSSGDPAEHPGGAFVRLKGREIIFLDPTACPEDRISVVAAAIRGRPIVENKFLPPEIRQAIDSSGD